MSTCNLAVVESCACMLEDIRDDMVRVAQHVRRHRVAATNGKEGLSANKNGDLAPKAMEKCDCRSITLRLSMGPSIRRQDFRVTRVWCEEAC